MDKNILNTIQHDFPLDIHPFQKLGEELGISEEEIIRRLERLQNEGAVRKIGPVINRNRVGGSSTLVAVNVPEDMIDEIADCIDEYPEVSHNYLRPDKYNVWFTLSASGEERINEILKELNRKTGLEFINLPTVRLFKIGVRFNIK
ncbi:Lrp/AsnC family transcriptional regulator [Methanolobus sp.]|uniref:siroheme decarboxylase subunit alpha n=1 Tax=Methanolobus sp. TaxID=1874737 RepID=UPI003522FB49